MMLGDKLHTKNNENTCFILVLRVNINFQHKKNFPKNYQSQGHYTFNYVTPNFIGWRVDILCFFFTIIILPHIFVRSISRRCLDQTLWNLVEISYAMWSCAFKGWFFQNGCRCHGNEWNERSQKNRNRLDKLCRSYHGNKKGGI